MAARGGDPYQTLGVSPDASDDQLHAAYRRLVQLHHPDHNAGSADSTRRFEEIQEAYATIRQQRESTAPAGQARTGGHAAADPAADSRLADLERQVREAHLARERARQAARQAASQAGPGRPARPTDEELGYVTTDDSFSKILADARAELSDRFGDAREHPVAERVADLIDELASKLKGEPPGGARK